MLKASVADITKLKDVDVIVNAANGIGVMGKGVSGAIAKSGGTLLRESVRKVINDNKKAFETGEVYISDAGLMKRMGIQQVYHGVVMKFPGGPTSLEIVTNLCESILKIALENKVKSIAFPGMGTGIGRLDKKTVAERMATILEKFTESIDITVVDINEEFIEAFKKKAKIV